MSPLRTRDALRSVSAASCSVAFRSANPFTRWTVPFASRRSKYQHFAGRRYFLPSFVSGYRDRLAAFLHADVRLAVVVDDFGIGRERKGRVGLNGFGMSGNLSENGWSAGAVLRSRHADQPKGTSKYIGPPRGAPCWYFNLRSR